MTIQFLSKDSKYFNLSRFFLFYQKVNYYKRFINNMMKYEQIKIIKVFLKTDNGSCMMYFGYVGYIQKGAYTVNQYSGFLKI